MVKAKDLRSTEYLRSCKGKLRFTSLEAAQLAAQDYNQNRRVLTFGDYTIEGYTCRFCRNYHIGHRRVYA